MLSNLVTSSTANESFLTSMMTSLPASIGKGGGAADDSLTSDGVGASDMAQIVLLGVLVVISVMGNLLVVGAVAREQRLRTYTNYFIVSLACADLLVSVVVVPVSIVYQTMRHWMFGQLLCTLYTSLDIMCCTASIINLCAISLDRYWAIVTPFQYQHKMTRRTCPLIIASVWLSSATIAVAQIGWRYVMGELPSENKQPKPGHFNETINVTLESSGSPEQGSEKDPETGEELQQCQISLDFSFRVFSSMSSFYVPLVVMLFTYSRIFAVAQRQSKAMAEQLRQCNPTIQQNGILLTNNNGANGDDQEKVNNNNNNHNMKENDLPNSSRSNSTNNNTLDPNCSILDPNGPDGEPQPNCGGSRNASVFSRTSSFRGINRFVQRATKFVARSNPLGQATELKAFKTLSIVMGVFIVNWFPFFGLYLVEGYQQRRLEGLPAVIVMWLGYFNSVLNPFIYFFFNKQYREAFIKMLCPASRRKLKHESTMLAV